MSEVSHYWHSPNTTGSTLAGIIDVFPYFSIVDFVEHVQNHIKPLVSSSAWYLIKFKIKDPYDLKIGKICDDLSDYILQVHASVELP